MLRLAISLLLSPALGDSGCSSHVSASECIAFRHQDDCAWDVHLQICVSDIPCELRGSTVCERELTNGASWDATQNKCFWDGRLKQCRWSEECFVREKDACLQAGCSWRRVCTPQDMSVRPGPNVCSDVCSIPGTDDPLPGNRTRLRASQRSATENRKRQGSSPVVETSTGPVQGNQLPDIQEFLGIPFAQAPVDQLRWAPSKQMERWNAVFQATEFGAACTQQSSYYAGDSKKCQGSTRGVCLGYSEDCLTLNIWTPSTTGRRAVMLWIHGGCYVSGSASDLEYNATSLAATTDVVVVSVQYRLGVFGFLGSPDMRSRDPQGSTGNYGLMDNIAALRWVQSNIAAFGGDPSRVTIFGESSGAGSVSLLMGVEESWPFYQQAIMESGTGSFWSYITLEGAQNNWQQVLAATKCSSDANSSSSSLITCILAASRSLLTDAVQQIPCRDGCTWAPVLDGVFLRGTPVQQAKQGLLRPNTPSISGFNRNDGAMFVTGYPVSMLTMSESSLDDYFSKRFGEERKATLQKLFPPSSAGGGGWTSQYFNAASACETDFSYSCTALWISTWSSPSFVYKFSEPDFEGLTLHGDEIPYIFGTLSSPSAQQTQLSSLMMQYWSNFAKGGDPNGPSLPPWPSWGGEVLLNISAEPVLVTVPNNSWPGCSFFLENWDFYSLCLPGTVQTQRSVIV